MYKIQTFDLGDVLQQERVVRAGLQAERAGAEDPVRDRGVVLDVADAAQRQVVAHLVEDARAGDDPLGDQSMVCSLNF